MKQFYFYMFDVVMLFYIYLPSWPNINALYPMADRERFLTLRVHNLV
jgi:hypothetical protein